MKNQNYRSKLQIANSHNNRTLVWNKWKSGKLTFFHTKNIPRWISDRFLLIEFLIMYITRPYFYIFCGTEICFLYFSIILFIRNIDKYFTFYVLCVFISIFKQQNILRHTWPLHIHIHIFNNISLPVVFLPH